MKQKIIVGAGLILLFAIIFVMSYDLFFTDGNKNENLYEYTLEKYRKVDTTSVCYKESYQIIPANSELHGIAIDNNDNIFITTENMVLVYNSNRDSVGSFKTTDKALCIAADHDGKLYLGFKNHIEVWDTIGKLLQRWEEIKGVPFITSIAVDNSSVFVADAGNKIVHHFNLNGEPVNQIGKKDPQKGIAGFFIPSPYFDVLIGLNHEVIAINTGRHSFEYYTREGELISVFDKTSMSVEGFSGCCNPSNVAMLSDGSFVTSEKGLERVKIHSANGEFKCIVASPEHFVPGTKGLDLAVDSKDRIYVLDPEKKMIRIFEKI